MRRALAIVVVILGCVVLLSVGSAAGGEEGNYEVRAAFDNAAFLVNGEEVRIAGANVGVITDVTVSDYDEAIREDGSADPGKAIVVMQIDDPGFQDFRADASCLIRPQSLIGEKFVECEPTQPRAAGTEPPPPLEQIPDGEPGAGQHLLPLERNGKAVDLDLVNDIYEQPYPDRFRLILNDLGAGVAARGDELAEIIERGNPALRETNEVLAILAKQNRTLSKLAADSDRVITALANRRENIADFINASQTTAAATVERSADLEASFQKFPGFLRELRLTMNRLDAFSTEATPVFANLRAAAPSLTRATLALGPFSNAGTTALTSLGKAAEQAGPDIVSADPVIKQVRGLANKGVGTAKNLNKLLASLRKTGGFEDIAAFLFNSSGAVNGFDQYGHFLRAVLPLNNCVGYDVIPEPGCIGTFTSAAAQEAAAKKEALRKREKATLKVAEAVAKSLVGPQGDDNDGNSVPEPGEPGGTPEATPVEPVEPTPEPDPLPPTTPTPLPDAGSAPDEPSTQSDATTAQRMRAAADLLDFIIGERAPKRGKR